MSGAAEPAGRVQRLARRPLEQMNGVVRGVLRALPRAVEDMFADRCTQYAAAIAYRVLFSLFPLDDRARLDLRARAPGRRAAAERHQRAHRLPPGRPDGSGRHPALDRGDRDAALRDRPHLARRADLGRLRDDGVDPARAGGRDEGRPGPARRSRKARGLHTRGGFGRSRPRDRRDCPRSARSSARSPIASPPGRASRRRPARCCAT